MKKTILIILILLMLPFSYAQIELSTKNNRTEYKYTYSNGQYFTLLMPTPQSMCERGNLCTLETQQVAIDKGLNDSIQKYDPNRFNMSAEQKIPIDDLKSFTFKYKLFEWLNKLWDTINGNKQKISELETKVDLLESELCKKDNTYKFCRGVIEIG